METSSAHQKSYYCHFRSTNWHYVSRIALASTFDNRRLIFIRLWRLLWTFFTVCASHKITLKILLKIVLLEPHCCTLRPPSGVKRSLMKKFGIGDGIIPTYYRENMWKQTRLLMATEKQKKKNVTLAHENFWVCPRAAHWSTGESSGT